jgi:hypothetical protein
MAADPLAWAAPRRVGIRRSVPIDEAVDAMERASA